MGKKYGSDRTFHMVSVFIIVLCVIAALIPFMLLVSSSLTDEVELVRSGYFLIPRKISLDAYEYLFHQAPQILKAYGITIFVTAVGTALSFILSLLLAYSLANPKLPGVKLMNFLVIFTMLFQGGMVPTYLVYTRMFHIKNTLAALIVPYGLVSAYLIIILKSYFKNSIPASLIESAYLDGASEFTILLKIVTPLSVPVLATITIMNIMWYWNDWYNGMMFVTDSNLNSIQMLLNEILQNVNAISTSFMKSGSVTITKMPSTSIRMAIAVIGVVPILIIYPFFQKYFVKGITLGAVKE